MWGGGGRGGEHHVPRVPGHLKNRISHYVTDSGEPGLVDWVLALHAGSRGFDSHRGTCPNNFSDPIDQDIRTK